jgi:DNA-binding NarL/FixJ family response regulator
MVSTTPIFVLIVDDNPVFLKRLDELVASFPGFEVTCLASSSEEALQLLDTTKIDLLITDLVMSGMSGLELTRRVRSQNLLLRVIVVSGHDDLAYHHSAVRAGADGFLTKGDLHGQLGPLLAHLFLESNTQ